MKVYRYTFPDGKIYIGVTKNSIQYRKDCGYQHNKPLTCAIREAGWQNVRDDILAEADTSDEAFALEQRFIEEQNATDPSHGYNVSKGGKATFMGLKHSAEHRAHMSKILSGIRKSDETRRRCIKAHERESIGVIARNAKGEAKEFRSLHHAASEVGGHPTNVHRACNSGRIYKGYTWERR